MANDRRRNVPTQAAGTPTGLSGEHLDQAGGFAIKGAGALARPVAGAVRSPLAGGIVAPNQMASGSAGAVRDVVAHPVVALTPAKAGARPRGGLTVPDPGDAVSAVGAVGAGNALQVGNRQEVSQIRGLHDADLGNTNTVATHLSYAMYDTSRGRSRRWGLISVVIAALLVAGALTAYPAVRRKVFKQISTARDDVVALVRHKRHKVKPAKDHAAAAMPSDDLESVVPGDEPHQSPGRRPCSELAQASTGGSGSLALADRLDLIDCYQVADDPVSAEAALKPLQSRLTRITEAELNGAKANRTIADAYLTEVSVLLKEGKARDAGELIRSHCTRWEQTNACVGKLMLVADRKIPGDGGDLHKMFETSGTLDSKAQARLWLAGAQIALTAGQPQTADKRYGRSLVAAPPESLALRKQIYETQALDLYGRGEVIQLKIAVTRALADLQGLDKNARTKLSTLLDLSKSSGKARAAVVKSLLTREEVTYRASGDFDLIEILGPESLRAGLEDDYLRLLKRTRDYYTSKYRSLDAVGKRLAVWEIRATLSKGQVEPALALLTQYDKAYGADPLSHHLRGIDYAATSPNEKYQLLAAREFQEAQRSKRDWEGLYALGATMIRSGHPGQVAPVIKDLDQIITTKGQRYWADMLKAEWYLAQGKYLNAQKILAVWSSAEPDWLTPRQLGLQLYQKTGKTAEAQHAREALDDWTRRQRFSMTFEGLASPLGAMALAKRPID